MGRLVVLVTSPRVPAGLLSGSAWAALHEAGVIAAADPRAPLASALAAQGLDVVQRTGTVTDLLRLTSDADGTVVWLADHGVDGDDDGELLRSLATQVVEGADEAGSGPTVEVIVGSFDPVGARLLDLVEVMDRLRLDCPWDRQQTHESLVRYLVEEAYETVEAIETGDRDHLREELGDLLLQVFFHARLAQEYNAEPFGIDDVAAGIVDKMIRRHPHVFGAGTHSDGERGTDTTPPTDSDSVARVQKQWDQIKAAEKSRESAMDGIPPGLPALSLADKLLDRARGSVSSPWPSAPDASSLTEQELGAALLSLVAAAHDAGLDPEQALRQKVREQMAQVRAREQRATPAAAGEPG